MFIVVSPFRLFGMKKQPAETSCFALLLNRDDHLIISAQKHVLELKIISVAQKEILLQRGQLFEQVFFAGFKLFGGFGVVEIASVRYGSSPRFMPAAAPAVWWS
ncbi:MAG: hypothetical protein IKW76_00465 [Clostridia bacterium]|nr:hypothetical protein [Clostridia bacterium]